VEEIMEQKIRFELSSDKNIVSKTSLTERAFRVNICMPDSTKQAERSPLNIALIIDRSGSMSGEKLAYARNAAAHVVSLLQGQDHVSVITFDNNVQIVSPSMQATPVNKSMITQEIMALAAKDSIFMHCLPAHRGDEVSAAVIDGNNSVVWREAFHRRTTIQAILYHLTRGELKGSLS